MKNFVKSASLALYLLVGREDNSGGSWVQDWISHRSTTGPWKSQIPHMLLGLWTLYPALWATGWMNTQWTAGCLTIHRWLSNKWDTGGTNQLLLAVSSTNQMNPLAWPTRVEYCHELLGRDRWGSSLVVQWLGVHLETQRRISSPDWRAKIPCAKEQLSHGHNHWAWALTPQWRVQWAAKKDPTRHS